MPGSLPSETTAPQHYWCFISYRHADNNDPGRQWATWLHQQIETYEVPTDLVGTTNERGDVIPERIFPVFRDEEELPADADLGSPIYRALDRSLFLLVLCSPRAVQSIYVANEILYFKKLGKSHCVLAAMIDGEPNASLDTGKQNDGVSTDRECFPQPLQFVVDESGALDLSQRAEPIAADFRLPDGSQGWTSPEAYRLSLEGSLPKAEIAARVTAYEKQCKLAWLKIVAGILGVALGTLTKRDKAYQLEKERRRARIFRGVAVALGVLALLAIAAGALALIKQREAVRQKQELAVTLSRSDYSRAVDLAEEGETGKALAYLGRAITTDEGNHAAVDFVGYVMVGHTDPFRQLVPPLRHGDGLWGGAAFSPDGTRVVTASNDKTARVWDAATGKPITEPLRHGGGVWGGAAFSPDGTRVVTASIDKTARVWDATSGKPVTDPLQHGGPVKSAAFSPDGTRVVTASGDKTARVWDAATGKPVTEPLRHGGEVRNASFSSDGTRVVTASGDKTARVWDAATGKPITEPLRHGGPVFSAAFSPDGTRTVTASGDNTARVWDAATGKPVTEPLRHAPRSSGLFNVSVTSAAFSPDGTRVVTACRGPTARVWDAATGMPVSPPLLHDQAVYSATFSPDGTRVLTASVDKTARVWDTATGKLVAEPFRHDSSVWSAAFSPDGTRIVTASDDSTARVWVAAAVKSFTEPLRHRGPVHSAAFSPDGTRVVTASWDKTARVWDAATGKPVTEPLLHDAPVNFVRTLGGALDIPVNSAAFSPDGMRVVTACRGSTASVWDAATGKPITEPLRHGRSVTGAAFSPDGTRVLTASYDQTARVWDAATGKPITEPLRHGGRVWSAAFSPDGTHVLTASDDYTARVWDAATGMPVSPPLRHDHAVWSAALSPDGTRVLTASQDKTARVWDAATGMPVTEPLRHGSMVWSAAFSPDGTRVITASRDNTARVWDAATGMPITEPLRHDRWLMSAAFSADGTHVVTASQDQTARVWDAATGMRVTAEPLRHGNTILSAAFSPDGTRVVTASSDKTARVWDVRFPATPAVALHLIEAAAGYRMGTGSGPKKVESPSIDDLRKRRSEFLSADGTGPSDRWVAWYLDHHRTRTISPYSSLSIPDYIERRIEESNAVQAHLALQADPSHPLIQIGLAAFVPNQIRANFLRAYGLERLSDPANLELYGHDTMIRYANKAAEMLAAQGDETRAAAALEYAQRLE